MLKILILDSNQRSALAATRSLGKWGQIIHTADVTESSLAGSSRYAKFYHVYPSPETEQDKFVDYLVTLVQQQQIDLLLPMTELTANLILQHRDSFAPCIIPFADVDVVNCVANKCWLMQKARELDVPIPNTLFVDDPSHPQLDLTGLEYPLVLKPGLSWLYQDGKWIHTSVRFADDANTAATILKQDESFRQHPYMLQQRVSGNGQGVFALYNNGSPVAFFSHRRIREKPPWGGVSVLSESVPVDPTLLRHARALLDAVGWHGIAMVEFKVSGDGRPYLMEINTRFWGSLQLAIDAGVDFPRLLVMAALKQPLEPVSSYRTGQRLRWWLGDLDSLYLSLRDGRTPIAAKLKALVQFCLPAPFKNRHEVNRWQDLGPFWWELKKYLQDLRS